MRFVFLHGGPGFNSFAEEAILGRIFEGRGHAMTFWNEPSRLRPDGDPFDPSDAFARWLASAEQCVKRAAAAGPVHVIGHSCTIAPAVEIVRRHPDAVASLTLAGPAADIFATFTSVMRLAHDDLLDVNPEAAAVIARSLARTRVVMDDAMREGLLMAAQHDERLFTHYFADGGQFRASMAARERPEAQFDGDSFFAVLPDLGTQYTELLSRTPITVPTLALFGGEDQVTPLDVHCGIIERVLPHARIEVLEGCGHYVHLDRPDAFADVLISWVTGVP